jgi:hypothetical protein
MIEPAAGMATTTAQPHCILPAQAKACKYRTKVLKPQPRPPNGMAGEYLFKPESSLPLGVM